MCPNVPTMVIKSLTKHRRLSQPLVFTLVLLALIYPYPVWGSPYQTADHFWPLQNISSGGLLKDVQGAAHTIVYNGGKIKKVDQLGTSLYLDGMDDWVDTGNFRECSELREMKYGCGFNADCVTDPTRCTDGFTLAFWLKVYGSGFIMSSGSFTNSKRGPGFRLVYDTRDRGFEFVLETSTKRWRIHIQGEVNKWTHMVFSWKETIGIEYYEDGNLSTYNDKNFFITPRRRSYTPVITLARPSNVMDVRKFGHFEISQFGIWIKWLSYLEISGIFLNSVVYNQNTALCCYYKKVALCTTKECYNARYCKRIDKTHKCLCPRLQRRTCSEKITGYCVDQVERCKLYANQPKYCKNRKMREVCPRSCQYCAAESTTDMPVNPPKDFSSMQGISPGYPSSFSTQPGSRGSLFISQELIRLDTTSAWPVSATPTFNPSSSSYVPDLVPSSTIPFYGNITSRIMPTGKNCEELPCSYYAKCRMRENYAKCECKVTCSLKYEPVCGTNSKTYSNKCVLRAESCILGRWIRVAKKGYCGSRYPNAAHYWPFNSTSSSKTLLDVRGKCKTLTYNGVRTTHADQLGPVLSLDGIDDWIVISEIKSKCINDPTLCSKGLTVAFWIRYYAGEFILSGGRYTYHQGGPGFRFICLNCASATDDNSQKESKNFILNLSTQTKEWKITLDFLPKSWLHLAFTWHPDNGLNVYKNGKLFVKDTTPTKVKFPSPTRFYDSITLGRPNSITNLQKCGKFDIGHLVIWRYELSAYEVELAFFTVLAKTTKSLICCHFKKGDPCIVNPCATGENCRTIDEKYSCICPEITERPCTEQVPIYPCVDRSDDCPVFASQTGYCENHKKYLMSMCAKSCKFCSSVAVTQRSIIHPEASPSFLGPNVILTAGSGSQTKFLQPGVSKTQSQRMPTVSPTPTPYPTVPPPHFCDIGPSQSCICMNCEGNTNQGFPCCIDVLDPVYLKEGIVLSMTSISLADFLAKQPKLQKILGELVADHCAQTSCTQDIDSKRLKRNVMNDDTGQNTAAKEPDRYIRSWNSSAYKPSNTIRPYPPKNSPTKIVLSTIASNYPPLTRPVDVKVVVFKIAQNVAQNEQLSAGLYVAVTSSVGGTNRTYVLKADLLSGLIRSKRDVLKRKLNITIDSITTWKEWQVTHSIRPRVADSVSSGFTPTLGASVTPGPKSPNVESQEGGNSTTNMSRGTFIIVLVTGIGGFVVLSVIIIYMLFKFLRRMKGEFVPDKVYPNEQKANGGSDQLIPSFVDPSSPRITDVPKKTVRPGGSSGSSGDPGSGGGKKNKKPMGVKVTYKPPKWD